MNYLQDEGDSITVAVERTGGALVPRSIFYSIGTENEAEFFGATGVLVFAIGETQKTATIVVADDDIPEVRIGTPRDDEV